MKNPSKMSFRKPRTVIPPPTEVEIFVAPPSPVFAAARDVAPGAPYSFLFPRDGLVTDLTVRAEGLAEKETVTVTIVPEGINVVANRVVVGAEHSAIEFSAEVKKGQLVQVEVDKGVPVLHVAFMFYPGMTANGYEKEKEKKEKYAGS